MRSLTYFNDILDKMKGLLQEPTVHIMICKFLLVDPACAIRLIRLSRRRVLFSGLKCINATPLDNDSRKVH